MHARLMHCMSCQSFIDLVRKAEHITVLPESDCKDALENVSVTQNQMTKYNLILEKPTALIMVSSVQNKN